MISAAAVSFTSIFSTVPVVISAALGISSTIVITMSGFLALVPTVFALISYMLAPISSAFVVPSSTVSIGFALHTLPTIAMATCAPGISATPHPIGAWYPWARLLRSVCRTVSIPSVGFVASSSIRLFSVVAWAYARSPGAGAIHGPLTPPVVVVSGLTLAVRGGKLTVCTTPVVHLLFTARVALTGDLVTIRIASTVFVTMTRFRCTRHALVTRQRRARRNRLPACVSPTQS